MYLQQKERGKMADPYKIYNRKILPEKMREFRTLRGYSEQHMAIYVFGESTHTYRYREYEAGVRVPKIPTLLEICKVLQCRIDDLAPKLD